MHKQKKKNKIRNLSEALALMCQACYNMTFSYDRKCTGATISGTQIERFIKRSFSYSLSNAENRYRIITFCFGINAGVQL